MLQVVKKKQVYLKKKHTHKIEMQCNTQNTYSPLTKFSPFHIMLFLIFFNFFYLVVKIES